MMMKIVRGVVLLATAFLVKAEDIKLYGFGTSSLGTSVSVEFRVPREELEKIPTWEPKSGTRAPLTRNQAEAIARKAAAGEKLGVREDTNFTIALTKIYPAYLRMEKMSPVQGCQWFYLVHFMENSRESSLKCDFVVTMGGTVARRQIIEN